MSIRDHLPAAPGSRLAYAYRAIEREEAHENRAAEERQRERSAKLQEQRDGAENMAFITGRAAALTQAELFATASMLGDLEDAAEERRRTQGTVEKHKFGEPAEILSRADLLQERANILRAQRDELHRSENLRAAVDAARAKLESRVAARRGSSRSAA